MAVLLKPLGYGLDCRRMWVRFSAGTRDVTFCIYASGLWNRPILRRFLSRCTASGREARHSQYLLLILRMCGRLPPLAGMPSGRSAKATGTTLPVRYPHTETTDWRCYVPADCSECQKCEIESLAFLRIRAFCTVILRSNRVVFFSLRARTNAQTDKYIHTHTLVFIVSYCVAMNGFKMMCWKKNILG